jgi:hypothetical protein
LNALLRNTTGNFNIASGVSALYSNTTGGQNIASGNNSLRGNTTGSNNISIGYQAGYFNRTGNNNTYLDALANSGSADLSNSTAIGYQAFVNASNKVRIGNSSVIVIEGQVAFTNPSDRRLKEHITANNDVGLEFISRLQPVL